MVFHMDIENSAEDSAVAGFCNCQCRRRKMAGGQVAQAAAAASSSAAELAGVHGAAGARGRAGSNDSMGSTDSMDSELYFARVTATTAAAAANTAAQRRQQRQKAKPRHQRLRSSHSRQHRRQRHRSQQSRHNRRGNPLSRLCGTTGRVLTCGCGVEPEITRSHRRAVHLLPLPVVLLLVLCCMVLSIGAVLAFAIALAAAAGSVVMGGIIVLAFVAMIHSITPFACLLMLIRCVGFGLLTSFYLPEAFVEAWMALEAAFYAYYFIQARRLRRTAAAPPVPPGDRETRWRHLRRMLEHTPDMRRALRGWFKGSPRLRLVRQGNMEEWLAWAFFTKDVAQLDEAEQEEVHEMLTAIRNAGSEFRLYFQPGYNPDVKSLRLNLDRHRSLHRPLVYYVVIYAMDFAAVMFLRGMGFRRHSTDHACVSYWYRPAPAPNTLGRGPLHSLLAMTRRIAGAVTSLLDTQLGDRPERQRGLVELPPPVGGRSSTATLPPYPTRRQRQLRRWPSGNSTKSRKSSNTAASEEDSGADSAWGYTSASSATPSSSSSSSSSSSESDSERGGKGATPIRRRSARLQQQQQRQQHQQQQHQLQHSTTGSESESSGGDDNDDDDDDDTPIVFFHGIGVGLTSYLQLIWDLIALRRATIVVEVPAICTRIAPTMATEAAVVDAVHVAMQAHGHTRGATLVGHSFGTIHMAWVLRALPNIVRRAVFVDPVTFMLAEPDVCSNFMYRSPANADELATFYMASTELSISHAVGRHFFWQRNISWFEDFPRACRVTVLLSGNDSTVPAHKVKHYIDKWNDGLVENNNNTNSGTLKGHPVNLLWYPRLVHGGFLANSDARADVVKATAAAAVATSK